MPCIDPVENILKAYGFIKQQIESNHDFLWKVKKTPI